MSWVANVLLSVSLLEDDVLIQEFSQWLEHDAQWNGPSEPPHATGVGFLKPIGGGGQGWGGWKNPEVRVWAGVTNHADVDAIVDRFGVTPWQEPDAAQLLIKDQEQDYFRLWMIREGRVQRFGPESDDA